jgi:hypothetical protein
MKLGRWLGGAAVAVTLGMFSASAQAAPLSGPADGLKATANENALTQDVRYGRRCWRHRGHLHCHRGVRRHHGYYYGSPYYYGPSIGFSFGGGRHHHHRHHRHHGRRH